MQKRIAAKILYRREHVEMNDWRECVCNVYRAYWHEELAQSYTSRNWSLSFGGLANLPAEIRQGFVDGI